MIEGFLLVVCAVVILYAGPKVSRYADAIAAETGIGRTWIGLVLLAAVTSMPELITGASAVLMINAPDLAVGNVLGAAMLNMVIVAGLGIAGARLPRSVAAQRSDVVAGLFGVAMLALVALAILGGKRVPAVGWVGAFSLAFVVLYVAALRATSAPAALRASDPAERVPKVRWHARLSQASRRTLVRFIASALAIVAAASALPYFADAVAAQTGLGRTFIGTTLVAILTTLPEVVVSVAAFRIGAASLALGNLFGSNLLNILLLAVDDLLYVKGPILAAVSPNHIVGAVAAILLTFTVLTGLRPKAGQVAGLVAFLVAFLVYGLAVWIVYARP